MLVYQRVDGNLKLNHCVLDDFEDDNHDMANNISLNRFESMILGYMLGALSL